MTVYIKLIHGRDRKDIDMEEWGFDGPVIGPVAYVQITYLCDVKFACSTEVFDKFFASVAASWRAAGVSNINDPNWQLNVVDDLIEYDGKFYGDFVITTEGGEK